MIPHLVSWIGSNAFEGCKSLVSLTIPDSVRQINGEAFAGCSSLANLGIPRRVVCLLQDLFRTSDAFDMVMLVGRSSFFVVLSGVGL